MSTRNVAPRWVSFLVVGFILLISFLHFDVYGGRNYREDEINSIHGAFTKNPIEIVKWMSTDLHPPGWRLFADFWVDSFGGAETVTRWSSTLINILTFALIFQLGRHLVDWRVGLFAIALLGLYTPAANAMNELRPYPMLIMLTTALHLVFYCWLHNPNGKLMIIYILLGILATYTHFFAFFIFATHVVYLVIFVKFERTHWFHSIAMWFFIGLSFLGWILPFIHTITVPFRGGIYYALPEGLVGIELLIKRLRFRPENIGLFLLTFSLFTPMIATFGVQNWTTSKLRFRNHWNILFPSVLLIASFLIALFANSIVSSVTARNMIIITPTLILLMALGLRLLPIQASLILLVILTMDAPKQLSVSSSNGPYREMIQFMTETYEDDSIVLTEFSSGWRWLTPSAYFLMDFTPDKMSKSRMYHIVDPDDNVYLAGNFPELLNHVYQDISVDSLNEVIPNINQLWLLQQGGGTKTYDNILPTWLNKNYTRLRSIEWDEPYPTNYTLTEYARIPDNADLMLRAGETFNLYSWSLKNSIEVNPCQTITIESWWQTNSPIDTPYTLILVLADDRGQVAIHERVPADVFTTKWEIDTYYRDISALTIPCDVAQGSYNLLLGMKNSITGESLPLAYPDENSIGTLYYLTTLNTQGS